MNDQEWQALRNKARGIAIEEYSTEASSIIRLTKAEITSIIETAEVDKEKLSELISVVNDASKSNSEKADAIKNITGLAEVAVSLIGKLT
ncbi:MAG: hypothetical protein L3J98_14525 [Gammaproteobacteria bacterium]|nr:hypothetical protein [Gammaproteobacteria bacterium]MCF6261353.1 hypothetical protein [Gammaproteobacteria bacterium]